MLDLVFQNLTASKKYNSEFFEKILIAGLKELKLGNKNIEVSISLVGETRIKELNKKYRNKNRATDVLSFPMSENSNLETRDKKQVKPEILVSGRLPLVADLGDIFICLSFAKREAKSENIDIERKIAHLTVHGFLHLVGYDHENSSSEAEKMFNLENNILRQLKF